MPKIFSKKYLIWFFIIIILLVAGGITLMLSRSPKSGDKGKKTPTPLETITIQPTQKHSASVVFLHGLGNNAQNQKSICQPLAQKFPHIKFIIPQAPTISVSMNGGFRMPAWYNISWI